MKLYYETRLGKLYHGDCIELLNSFNDNEIDLVLTDPPYGIGVCKAGTVGGSDNKTKKAKMTKYGKCDWDLSIPEKRYFDEMLRAGKNQIIFGGNYFIEYLYNSACWIVWDKLNEKSSFADCELAWTSFTSAIKKIEFRWNGMLQHNMKIKEKRYHPTQKPIGLFIRILRKYADENTKVLDCFMGSGTTAIACERLGMQWIGIEKEEKYCQIIKERLKQETKQLKLF